MIKLTQLLNELGINNPNPTAKEVYDYFIDNLAYNNNEFNGEAEGWIEYRNICQPYKFKYNIMTAVTGLNEFSKLSQSELNKLYKEMKQLVHKYININELNVNKPVRTWDFSKHIPNFDPRQMKKGDKIINYENNYFKLLIFDEINDENKIITHTPHGSKVVMGYNQMLNYWKFRNLNELQISTPKLYIYGEYGDVQYFANGPLKGEEVELLETEDDDEQYKISFIDNKGKPKSPLFPQILDLHDYQVFTSWLKRNKITFIDEPWSGNFSGEGTEVSGIDLYIPAKLIKFIKDESI